MLLHVSNIFQECIPIILDACLDQQETFLQLVALGSCQGALGSALGFWRRCSTICIIARVHWHLCSWHRRVVELGLVDDWDLLDMCIHLHKLHRVLHSLDTFE